MCALHCTQPLHTILHRTDLIILPLTLQTIIIAQMLCIWWNHKWMIHTNSTTTNVPHLVTVNTKHSVKPRDRWRHYRSSVHLANECWCWRWPSVHYHPKRLALSLLPDPSQSSTSTWQHSVTMTTWRHRDNTASYRIISELRAQAIASVPTSLCIT